MEERTPPIALEAEQAVLGSVLIDPQGLVLVADSLKAKDFYRDGHKVIFDAMLSLQRDGIPADLITLGDLLERQGKLATAGDWDYLTSLVNCVPTSAHIEHYAKQVSDTARARSCIFLAGRIAASAYSGDIDGTIDYAMRQLVEMAAAGDGRTRDRAYANVLDDLNADILARQNGEIVGLRTGFPEIDNWTGGIEPGSLILLAGRPGSGKSALGLSIGRRYAGRCQHEGAGSVLYVTMEMSAMGQARRLVAARSDPALDTRAMRTGFLDECGDRIDTLARQFTRNWEREQREAGRTLWFADAVLTTQQLYLRALRAKHERDLRLLIIDQLDLFGDETGRKSENERIGDFSKTLKQMARSLDITILCLVQLNRKAEERADHRPELADLRASGRLEQDADAVMALYRPAYYFPPQEGDPPWYPHWAELLGLKCRDGVSNNLMPLHFVPEAASYTDWHSTDTREEEEYVAQREKGRAA